MQSLHKVNGWLNRVQQFLFPPTCLLCGNEGAAGLDLCVECRNELPYNHPACLRCGIPLHRGALLCGACQRKPPPYDGTLAVFRYRPPLDYLIPAFKFHGRLEAGALLGHLMAETLAADPRPLPDILLPVPLHRSRLRSRGYNQACELARPIASRLNIPLMLGRCQRVQATEEQTGLNATARSRNVRNAFRVERGLEGKSVAIVDDVVTTGSTVSELARALKRAGVRQVLVWACARAEAP